MERSGRRIEMSVPARILPGDPPMSRPMANVPVTDRPNALTADDRGAVGKCADGPTLSTLAAVTAGTLAGSDDPVVVDVTHDSRAAGPGVLFAARPGDVSDGHQFAPAAVAAGSDAIMVERRLDLDVPQLQVDSVARRLGDVAAVVHGRPSARLAVAGVTGTNGKTTCASLVETVLAAAGHHTGLIGTIATRIGGDEVDGVRTTPESTDLQRLLRRMLDAGVDTVAMEVSSHGLALGRVNGTRFAVAAFTNLTHDHLDFHGSMERYFAAKAELFTPQRSAVGVVNIDDPWGRRLVAQARIPIVTVSAANHAAADVAGTVLSLGPRASTVRACVGGRAVQFDVGLPGRFNVSNALLAVAIARVLGVDLDVATNALAHPRPVPGRMERIAEGQPFTVLVDYAHTPDSLELALSAARELTTGRVLVVIGCGGERDRAKRPAMGAAAVSGADLAIFTNDNPRGEDPGAILDALVAGARAADHEDHTVEPDRRAAIAAALTSADAGDVVVIAGKGHERGQQLADRTVAFDDRVVARELLQDVAR